MTLEQQLFALVEQHGLSSLSIQALRVNERIILSASAQGDNKCAFSKTGETSSAVVGSAIGELNMIRRPLCEDVATLEPMAEAA